MGSPHPGPLPSEWERERDEDTGSRGISRIYRYYGVSSTPGPLMGKALPCLATRVASFSNALSLAWDSVGLVAVLLSDLPLSVQFAMALKACALGGW